MPIYEYGCGACGKKDEILQKVNDGPPESCPFCGKPGALVKLVSNSAFHLKGGGWYSDLYSSNKKPESTEAQPCTEKACDNNQKACATAAE